MTIEHNWTADLKDAEKIKIHNAALRAVIKRLREEFPNPKFIIDIVKKEMK